VLTVEDIHLRFRGVRALAGVSLSVQPRETLGIIGPDGSGKSTLFNVISGIYRPDRGRVRLSGGEQQMLAIARALMRGPTLLVLDEPSLGLSPILVQTIYRAIKDLRERKMTILLAEQSASVALSLADRAYLLETGAVMLEGPGRTLRDDPRVREAYLGG
jgi:ABC-type branched-subunit amino acid transport system ATPase component